MVVDEVVVGLEREHSLMTHEVEIWGREGDEHSGAMNYYG